MQELLRILNLKGAVVTADAMHCQKQTAKIIIDREADYVIQVKDNQRGNLTHDEVLILLGIREFARLDHIVQQQACAVFLIVV